MDKTPFNSLLNNISHDHFYLNNKSKLNIKIVEKEKNTLHLIFDSSTVPSIESCEAGRV